MPFGIAVLVFMALGSLSCRGEPTPVQTAIPAVDTVSGITVRASVIAEPLPPKAHHPLPEGGRPHPQVETIWLEVALENLGDELRTLQMPGCRVGAEAYEAEPTVQAQPEWTDSEVYTLCPDVLNVVRLAPGQTTELRHAVVGTGIMEGDPGGLTAGEYYLVAVVRTVEPAREVRVLASPKRIQIP